MKLCIILKATEIIQDQESKYILMRPVNTTVRLVRPVNWIVFIEFISRSWNLSTQIPL